MKYKDFNHWELVEDDYFVNWVLRPNKHSDKFWKQFLADNPERSEEVLLAKEIVTNIRYTDKPRLNDTEYNDLFERIISTKRSRQPSDVFYFRKARYGWIKYAAAVTLVLASAILYNQYWLSSHQIDEETIQTLVKESPRGSKLTAVLGDGSRVKLNAGSRITYPKEFSDTLRLVYLTGEAFFEVIKKSNHPFIVRAGDLTTTVLGTSFNVKSFKGDRSIQVALKRGKVKVDVEGSPGRSSVYLEPGEAVEFHKADAQGVKKKIDPDKLSAWKDGVIVFKDADLDEIVQTLSRWYGVKIEVRNPKPEAWTYNGAFDNAILENVLKSISFSEEFSYSINQKNVIINFN